MDAPPWHANAPERAVWLLLLVLLMTTTPVLPTTNVPGTLGDLLL